MPNRDGTGPYWRGVKTEHGRGNGGKGGHGFRHSLCRMTAAEDPETLATQISRLESVLSTLKQRQTTINAGQS